jgi:hypothetical protein
VSVPLVVLGFRKVPAAKPTSRAALESITVRASATGVTLTGSF